MYIDTSVVLDEHYYLFIQQQLGEGRYQSANEVVSARLRLLEIESQKIKCFKKSYSRRNR